MLITLVIFVLLQQHQKVHAAASDSSCKLMQAPVTATRRRHFLKKIGITSSSEPSRSFAGKFPSVSSSSSKILVIKGGGKEGNDGATILQEVTNLVKAIVGAGVLTLPAGIAAFGNAPSAIIPAVILIATIGSFSAYGFGLIGRVCAMTQATNIGDAWSQTVGDQTAWIPAWTVVQYDFGGYSS